MCIIYIYNSYSKAHAIENNSLSVSTTKQRQFVPQIWVSWKNTLVCLVLQQ